MPADAQMMLDAANEIRSMRRRLEVLEAKDRVFEAMASLHFSMPCGSPMGASPDVAWQLEQRAAEMKKVEANAFVEKPGEAAP
jgi:hypothetical protein